MNFLQSSTRMCVERAFGMLKGSCRILLKKIDVHLNIVLDLVATCLVYTTCVFFSATTF